MSNFNFLRIFSSSTCLLYTSEALSAHRQAEKNSVHSIALVNVCERLEFLYGHPIHLKVQSELGKGTAFLFDLPRVTKGGSTS